MKALRNVACIFLVVSMLLVTVVSALAAVEVRVFLDGKQVVFPDQKPTAVSGRTFVPVRFVSEALGASVDWVDATQSVVITQGSKTVVLTVGRSVATVDGKAVALDAPARLIAGRTMVPLRFVSEVLGAAVDWDDVTNAVYIASETSASSGQALADEKVDEAGEREQPGPEPVTEPGYKGILQLGDYVTFGRYLGEPIVWRVVQIEEDGNPVLFAETIITYKAYSAAVSGRAHYTRDGLWWSEIPNLNEWRLTHQKLQEAMGSDDWEVSSLRDWLNSAEQVVTYAGHPPTQEAVALWQTREYDGPTNDYAQEPGFLTNFSASEIELILPRVNTVNLYGPWDDELQGPPEGGHDIVFQYKDGPLSHESTNEATAKYKTVVDRVFLLSAGEVIEWLWARGLPWQRVGTEAAKEQAVSYHDDEHSCYWLRSNRLFMRADFGLGTTSPIYGSVGVVPALKLNQQLAQFSGSGTQHSPYIISP